MGLAPDNQTERDGIIQQAHDEKCRPHTPVCWHRLAATGKEDQQGNAGKSHTAQDDGQWRQIVDSHPDKEIGPAPDQRQCQQQDPLCC